MTVTVDGKQFTLEAGTKISDFLKEHGFIIDAPCGCKGLCGKCRITASGALSPMTDSEFAFFTKDEIFAGMRLACLTVIEGDCRLSLVPEADSGGLVTLLENVRHNPPVSKKQINAVVPDIDNQLTDEENLGLGLPLTLGALKNLPSAMRDSSYSPYAIIADGRVVDVTAESRPVIGLAVDIGTTTVAMYVYNLETGELMTTKSALNAQRAFGADVISRIAACNDDADALEKQQNAIAGQITSLCIKAAEECGFDPLNVYYITIAANTTMLHLLTGVHPGAIANSPFIPATLFGFSFTAAELGIGICGGAPVCMIPSVSGYVGGDITAGISVCDMEGCALFIDIGTNGEMGISTEEDITVCSVAAGPAFEGAHIKHGVGGIPGAIEGVYVNDDSDITLKTIGDLSPSGICGSGLVDAISVLLSIGAIDETGRLVDADELSEAFRNRLTEDGFILDFDSGIAITAEDVREVQLAKSAICSGICTLMERTKKTAGDIRKVILAGGFGSHINPVSASKIGLLPRELMSKIEIAGNAAGMGACAALLDGDMTRTTREISKKCRYIELSTDSFFMDSYIENMMFI